MPLLKDPQREIFATQVAKGVAPLKAYITAGYGESSGQPYELVEAPDVAARIGEIRNIMAARAQISTDRVLAELAAIGFSDITELVSIERGRLRMKDTKDVAPDLKRAISEIQHGKTGIRVKLHDKKAALQLIGQHLGLFKENVDLNVSISLADLVNGSFERQGQVVDVTPSEPAERTAEIVEGPNKGDGSST
jgi:phage terminase small subunit